MTFRFGAVWLRGIPGLYRRGQPDAPAVDPETQTAVSMSPDWYIIVDAVAAAAVGRLAAEWEASLTSAERRELNAMREGREQELQAIRTQEEGAAEAAGMTLQEWHAEEDVAAQVALATDAETQAAFLASAEDAAADEAAQAGLSAEETEALVAQGRADAQHVIADQQKALGVGGMGTLEKLLLGGGLVAAAGTVVALVTGGGR